jgi:hypothetical protein
MLKTGLLIIARRITERMAELDDPYGPRYMTDPWTGERICRADHIARYGV